MPRFAVSFLVVMFLSALARASGDVPAEEAVPLTTYLTLTDQADKLADHWTGEIPRGTARQAMDSAVSNVFPPTSPLVENKHQDEDEDNPPPSAIFRVHPSAEPSPAEHHDVVLTQAPSGTSVLPYLVGIGVAGAILGIGLLAQFARRG